MSQQIWHLVWWTRILRTADSAAIRRSDKDLTFALADSDRGKERLWKRVRDFANKEQTTTTTTTLMTSRPWPPAGLTTCMAEWGGVTRWARFDVPCPCRAWVRGMRTKEMERVREKLNDIASTEKERRRDDATTMENLFCRRKKGERRRKPALATTVNSKQKQIAI